MSIDFNLYKTNELPNRPIKDLNYLTDLILLLLLLNTMSDFNKFCRLLLEVNQSKSLNEKI